MKISRERAIEHLSRWKESLSRLHIVVKGAGIKISAHGTVKGMNEHMLFFEFSESGEGLVLKLPDARAFRSFLSNEPPDADLLIAHVSTFLLVITLKSGVLLEVCEMADQQASIVMFSAATPPTKP